MDSGPTSSSIVCEEQLAAPSTQHGTQASSDPPGSLYPASNSRKGASERIVPTPRIFTDVAPLVLPHGAPYAGNNIPTTDDPSLTNLLNCVIHPNETLQNQTSYPFSNVDWKQNYHHRDLMDFSQDLSLDFENLDAALLGDWGSWLDPTLSASGNARSTTSSERSPAVNISSIDDSINLGTAAYSRSAWRWTPNHEKNYQDQTLASVLVASRENKLPRPRQVALVPPMDQSGRDRIVALLLAACEKSSFQKISTLFPSPR